MYNYIDEEEGELTNLRVLGKNINEFTYMLLGKRKKLHFCYF